MGADLAKKGKTHVAWFGLIQWKMIHFEKIKNHFGQIGWKSPKKNIPKSWEETHPISRENLPAKQVIWYDTKMYYEKLGKRLLDEQKWKKVIRADTTTHNLWILLMQKVVRKNFKLRKYKGH